ncbi:hypothetical protein Tco_0250847 [Tanacetum coccineum]
MHPSGMISKEAWGEFPRVPRANSHIIADALSISTRKNSKRTHNPLNGVELFGAMAVTKSHLEYYDGGVFVKEVGCSEPLNEKVDENVIPKSFVNAANAEGVTKMVNFRELEQTSQLEDGDVELYDQVTKSHLEYYDGGVFVKEVGCSEPLNEKVDENVIPKSFVNAANAEGVTKMVNFRELEQTSQLEDGIDVELYDQVTKSHLDSCL